MLHNSLPKPPSSLVDNSSLKELSVTISTKPSYRGSEQLPLVNHYYHVTDLSLSILPASAITIEYFLNIMRVRTGLSAHRDRGRPRLF